MRKMIRNKSILLLLVLLLCLGTVLVACEGKENAPSDSQSSEQNGTQDAGQNTDPAGESTNAPGTEQPSESEEQTTEPEPEKLTYTVSVIGSDGSPRQGAVVRFYKGEEQVTMVATAADGKANADLLPDTYTVVIDNILGEQYQTEGCILTPKSPALEVQLYGLPAAGEEIFAYSPAADDYVTYQAGRIGEGEYWTALKSGDMIYLLFVASRGGVFRVSADEQLALSIGYFGSTSFVLTESVATEENNAIFLEVYDDMVYNYAFVIGVMPEDDTLSACTLRVEYVGERKPTVNDMPWNNVMPEGELVQFTKPEGSLKNFDITDMGMTVVYNENDGYYHVGSADGAVLLLNLDNNSPYMDALTTVCSNMRLGVYVYDDEGNVISKDSYNDLIWAYNEVADGGYYPLDQTLADMMLAVGGYMGWYDASSPMSLFGAAMIVPEHAHLFACAYVQ